MVYGPGAGGARAAVSDVFAGGARLKCLAITDDTNVDPRPSGTRGMAGKAFQLRGVAGGRAGRREGCRTSGGGPGLREGRSVNARLGNGVQFPTSGGSCDAAGARHRRRRPGRVPQAIRWRFPLRPTGIECDGPSADEAQDVARDE